MSDFFNWDDEITNDGNEYLTLMPGKYDATVSNVERSRWSGQGKMNGCHCANMTLEVAGLEGKASINDTIFLASSMEWKIGQVLTACGLKQKGEPIKVEKLMSTKGKKCLVTVVCQLGKEDGYKQITQEEARERIENGLPVYNAIKGYAAAQESTDNEFGF